MSILHIVNMSSTGRRARITICIHTSVMMIGPQINNGIVLRKNSPNYVSRFSFSLFWVFANLPFTVIPFAVACFCYCLNSRKFILAIVSFRIFLAENTFGCYAFCSMDTISLACSDGGGKENRAKSTDKNVSWLSSCYVNVREISTFIEWCFENFFLSLNTLKCCLLPTVFSVIAFCSIFLISFSNHLANFAQISHR